MSDPVLVSGLGLMGGSLAAALSAAGHRVLLHARRPEAAAAAAERGWGEPCADLASAAGRAALAVVALPVSRIAAQVRAIAAAGTPVVTDVGSTKASLLAELDDLAAAGRFVGSHPMCGSHLQGLAHADPDLYQGARVVVTPHPQAPAESARVVAELWRSLGSRVCEMSAADHDRAVGSASHLPHILAAAAAAGLEEPALPLAASGFRDTTRVAAGDPGLWSEILLENRRALAELLQASEARLAELRTALVAGDGAAVRAWLTAGRAGRERFDHRTEA